MRSTLSKAKAEEQMVKSVHDLHTAKITLPLGNPNLKLVHTNQMLFTELPEDVFQLANFDKIATALNSKYNRYGDYVLNRWYIEGITITNDGKTGKMEIDVNPFASDVLKFRDEKESFKKAFNDALNQEQKKEEQKQEKKKQPKSVSKKLDINKAVAEVAKKWKHIGYSHCCQTASATKKNGKGDCWGMSNLLACELQKKGVKVKILNYPTSMSSNHRSVQYRDAKGNWQNFPYRKYGFHSWFNNTDGVKKGKVIPVKCN